MIHVADSSKNRRFDPFTGRFTPIRPTIQCCERKGPAAFGRPGTVDGHFRSRPGQRTGFVFVLDPAWVRHKSQYANN